MGEKGKEKERKKAREKDRKSRLLIFFHGDDDHHDQKFPQRQRSICAGDDLVASSDGLVPLAHIDMHE